MKRDKKTVIQILSILIFAAQASWSQQEIRIGDSIVCDFKAPSQKLIYNNISDRVVTVNSSESIAGRKQTFNAEFEVKYIGFPADAQAAVQKAIDIWALSLKSSVKIRIFVNWTVLQSSPNTLAFVVPTEVRNFQGSPNPGLWYPMTLAEKIAGRDINSVDEADIVATFNAGRTDWYFGTDGQPGSKFDLVTIALHEIGHGLGFAGTFRENAGLGFYGSSDGNPKVYDNFLVNGSGQSLLNGSLFPNSSSQLGTQLVGNSLVFKSDIAKTLNLGGSFPRIYAPNPFNGGSSISHLDEGQYNNTRNSLMTPFAGQGEVRHEIGSLVRGIFYEMGWLNTVIQHQNLGDQESLIGVPFSLLLNSDTSVVDGSVKMIYSFDNFISSIELALNNSVATPNFFQGEILNPPSEKTVSYYFTASDVFNRKYRYPINPSSLIKFYLGTDLVKPIVQTVPALDITEFDKQIIFSATVTDNIGVKKVTVEYQINNGLTAAQDMILSGSNFFSYNFDLTNLSPRLNQGDKITYRIIATDNSSQQNSTIVPSTGSYFINVRTFSKRESYSADFSSDPKDFFGDFSIGTPIGFVNGAIHSPHPYPKSPSMAPIDLTYVLLYPIQVKSDNSFIEFDEVVLVEPGSGDDFTLPAFGDYVISEGSKDQGQTWKPMASGYDSRKNIDWLNYYTSNIQNNDSRAIGTLNYYKRNSINILSTFASGDVINVRFRLRSDSQKSGWGWAIDNLKIQGLVTGFEEKSAKTGRDINVFPNPFQEQIIVAIPTEFVDAEIAVFDVLAKLITKTFVTESSIELDSSQWPKGVYFLIVSNAKGDRLTVRKLIK